MEVGNNGFTDLNSAHITFGNIADNLSGNDLIAILKHHFAAMQGIDFGNGKTILVLLYIIGKEVQIITNFDFPHLTVDTFVVSNFKFKPCHRGMFGADNDIFQIQIAVCAAEVFQLKTFELDFLHQTLIISIQRIQYINQIMLFCVGG